MRASPALLAAMAALLPAGAAAEAPVTPEEFGASAEGRTLHFTLDGLPYGSEQFFVGRRTVWQSWDGTCQTGRWYPSGDLVCFVYDAAPDPQCWRMRDAGGRLRALLVENGVATGPDLALAGSDTEPLACPGPEVGS